jgi:hypothetical protein
VPQLGNALYVVMSANTHRPVDRARHARFIKAAVVAAPQDLSVRFNAACLASELGDLRAATTHLEHALAYGADPEHAKQEPLLADLQIANVRPNQRAAPKRAHFIAHGPPSLRRGR